MLRLSSNLVRMKKFKSLFILLGILLFITPIYAQEDERILEFTSDIVVNSDASIDIKETIQFRPSTTVLRHGLEWRIPYIYSLNAFKRATKLDINSVTYYPLLNPELKTLNKYSRNDENGWAILRIGDADTYINGTYVYEIDYTLKYSGISYFDENDEVYLNVIGPGWNIPIENASANVQLPGEILELVCFTGPDGSQLQDCTMVKDTESSFTVKPNSTLNAYEGYTFAVKLPKGSIEDTTKQQILLGILANIGILLPIPVGIYLFGFLRKKYKNEKLTVIPYYEPDKDMDSLFAATLLSPVYKPKNISAAIIELATKGYFKIREYEKKKFEFIKSDKNTDDLPVYLKKIVETIFGSGDVVQMNKLTSFYETSTKAYTLCLASLKEQKIIDKNKHRMKSGLNIVPVIIILFTVLCSSFFILTATIGWLIGIIISLTLLFIFGFSIDTKTSKGNEIYHKLLGLKLYINTAEKHRIEFHNDPQKYIGVFEKLLPYAMIFGLEKKWANEFKDIYIQNPDWYEGDFTTFNSFYLVNSLGSFNNSMVGKSSPPSSYSSGSFRSGGWSSGGSGFGGGGSSGGGGGGSGGGGW